MIQLIVDRNTLLYIVCKNLKVFILANRMPSESATQEEQIGTNFSFIAPSSEELWVRKPAYTCGKGRHRSGMLAYTARTFPG